MGKFAIPGAILIAGLLVAGAVFLSTQRDTTQVNQNTNGDANVAAALPITPDDHILGSPDAKLTVIEYSDIDCPFCKEYHETMKQIIDEYGPSGDVAWVYRHFPLTSNHPNARKHAIAAECVAELGGNDAFWNFIDILLANAPGNAKTDPARYGEFAAQVGVDEAALTSCREREDIAAHVDAEYNTAIEAGGNGTPFNVFVVEGQDPIPVGGALPYENMKAIIEDVLAGETVAS